MNCVKCGEVCRCSMESPASEVQDSDSTASTASSEAVAATALEVSETSTAWREELSARLNRYRSRRKALPPRYPSLRLPFDAVDPSVRGNSALDKRPGTVFETASNHALALDTRQVRPSDLSVPEPVSAPIAPTVAHEPNRQTGAKIIEFPRSAWAPPPPPLDQLAEPVTDRPRILDVPEVEPPAPALGGITIETVQVNEPEKRLGIDIPLQNAALGRRLIAGFIDAAMVAAASVLFGYIFWRIAAVRPPQFQLIGLAAAIPSLFWATYQYLLIVYAGKTPGLFLARLELKRFDGTMTNRSLRRWRVLASWLSAASLGMGYAWLFLDEDALCWHDRITHTYLAPKLAPKN